MRRNVRLSLERGGGRMDTLLERLFSPLLRRYHRTVIIIWRRRH